MTPMLLLSRDCIFYWTNVWIVPVEVVLDLIESELELRGVGFAPTHELAPSAA